MSEKHRQWYLDNGFVASHAEPCLFVCDHALGKCIVAAYVDDCCWVFENEKVEQHFVELYQKTFRADFAQCSRFLNMRVQHDVEQKKVTVDQAEYIRTVAAELLPSSELAKPCASPYSVDFARITSHEARAVNAQVRGKDPLLLKRYQVIVGVIMYVALASRPDIVYAAGMLARSLAAPTPALYSAAQRVVKYLYHTADLAMQYDGSLGLEPVAVCDSDWNERHSTAGWAAFIAGIPVSYASKKERCIALSSTEAEIIAASMCACDVAYVREILEHLGYSPSGPTAICCDNKGVTDIARDPMSVNALKHVKRRHFFVREMQEAAEVMMVPVASAWNVADIFTKALSEPRFTGLAKRLRGSFTM